MTQNETLFDMPSEYALEAHSMDCDESAGAPLLTNYDPSWDHSGPGVCHACGRVVPEGFTDACRACVRRSCEAQQMEEM